MDIFPLKANSTYIKAYFAALAKFKEHGHTTEGNTRSAFADLLKRAGGPYGWHLVEEYQFRGTKKQPLRADGALIDDLTLSHGIWEAKDTADDLKKEIRSKVEKGYPLTNTLFQSPDHAVLYQDSRIAFDKPLSTAENLVEVLQLFFSHQLVAEVDWEQSMKKFSENIPEVAGGIAKLLATEYDTNANFRERFAAFAELCRVSINPDLSDDAIRKMLVQHLLTERIFRKVFNNQEFLQRNVIAVEIEKVIGSITVKHFSRDQFLKSLDHFYTAIEKAAEQQESYTEKQHFLNAVYEKFFQRFDAKQADTHGIVYTPQPIVDFMVRSVEEILKQEFGKSLSDEGVHILDPFTGTGNFITRIMQEIKRSALPHKYEHELHCNEIMLLPYYIASMNIEHAYMEKVGEYRPFAGICLADTFDLSEQRQAGLAFMTQENTERVGKQNESTIFVLLGNPPYNAGQDVANDDNGNREYTAMHERIWETYAADSDATLLSTLDDPYIQAFRWATDRLKGEDGIVAYVTNGRFASGKATDGMRKHLALDFDDIYLIDLGGDVRSNPKISGTTHNVFGVQAGVAITILIRKRNSGQKITPANINVLRTPLFARKAERLSVLTHLKIQEGPWEQIEAERNGAWRIDSEKHTWSDLLSIASKEDKRLQLDSAESIFYKFSAGCKTNRDPWCYNFSKAQVTLNIQRSTDHFNQTLKEIPFGQLTNLRSSKAKLSKLKRLISIDDREIAWSDDLRASLLQKKAATFHAASVRPSAFRPFTSEYLYFDRFFADRVLLNPSFFGYREHSLKNVALGVVAHSQVPFSVLAVPVVASHDFGGRPTQFLPFYIYDKSGDHRRENITDWALNEFRSHYSDERITKWNIFHATYAILHHPEYRTRYAANLKRELPRIPFPPEFHAFAAAGKRLMELHIDYEQQPEYKLEQTEDPKAEISFRVQRMKLSKDKTELRYNEFLLLRGIPAGVYNYRLGNRSALEWVIDQYQVSTDKRSGIVNDPNREDDPKYILRLIGQVITVSLETNAIVASLPTLGLPDSGQQAVASQAEPSDLQAASE